jgi:hypothetical protein
MGLAGCWGRWSLLEPLSEELAVAEISSLEQFFFFFVRTDLKNRSHRRRQTVRTQFSKDDVDASDSLLVGLFDDDFNGDGRVRVD